MVEQCDSKSFSDRDDGPCNTRQNPLLLPYFLSPCKTQWMEALVLVNWDSSSVGLRGFPPVGMDTHQPGPQDCFALLFDFAQHSQAGRSNLCQRNPLAWHDAACLKAEILQNVPIRFYSLHLTFCLNGAGFSPHSWRRQLKSPLSRQCHFSKSSASPELLLKGRNIELCTKINFWLNEIFCTDLSGLRRFLQPVFLNEGMNM